ncbi:hypothetical protein BCR35DRAFT_355874 [Leucosporidium creatinivorum]|uniref:AAA+ ATPase domain-containing protein n=1 Tax=Leucosporidium creatinivorum TaxID=106004 RepID=A0A1Y2D5P2_9BASI|nr:hypothetical protein BCR35DRAFT_355874 [Leucosporidium creatinivorum]
MSTTSSSSSSSLGKRTRSTTPAGSPPAKRTAPNFTLNIPTKPSTRPSLNVTGASPCKSNRKGSPLLKENNPASQEERMAIDQPIQPPLTPSKRTKAAEHTLPTPATTPTKRDREESRTPTASTSSLPPLVTPRHITNIFAHAHVLLSTNSSISQLPLTGREKQRVTLITFLADRFPEVYQQLDAPEQGTSPSKAVQRPSLYVSGPPGIGKTALLSSVLRDFSAKVAEQGMEDEVKVHMENCSSLGSTGMASSVWERLGNGLGINMALGKGKARITGRQAFTNGLAGGGKFLIILDEVDAVQSSSSVITSKDLLNNLFALAREHSSSLTLIGIANSLDLTSRSLDLGAGSFLKTKGKGKATEDDHKPIHLHFPAYTSAEIQAIIAQRLGHLADSYPLDVTGANAFAQESVARESLPLVAEKALQICATKIANQTGDVRSAFDVVRRAVSALEASELAKLSATAPTPTTPTKPHKKKRFSATSTDVDPLSTFTASTAPRVTLSIISACLRTAGFGVPPELASLLANLNLNSRLALVGICIALSRDSEAGFETRAMDRTVDTSVAYKVYSEVVSREGTLKPINLMEFSTVKDTLEATAFIRTGLPSSSPAGRPKIRRSPSRAQASDPPIALSQYGLDVLVEALREVPATECERGMSAGALQETLRMSKSMLIAEEERTINLRRKILYEKRGSGRDAMAPRAGFHGNGLEEKPVGKKGKSYIGGRRKAAKEEDEQEKGEGSEGQEGDDDEL